MNKDQKRRCLTLARFLERVVAKNYRDKFKMFRWVTNPWRLNASKRGYACQTAACAAGWAATIPSFQREGYHLGGPAWIVPSFRGASGFMALKNFFGVVEPFAADNPSDPLIIAQYLRSAVEEAA